MSSLTGYEIALGLGAVAVLAAANLVANHVVRRPYQRIFYSLFVVLVAGTLVAALELKRLAATGAFAVGALDFAPAASALALSGGFVFLAFSLWSESSEQWQRLPQLLAALFAPSLAEALVFVGIVFSLTQYLLTPALGHIAAVSAAVLVTSASFGVYHFTHAAPWNSWHTIRILFVVWLFVGLFYALTGNLWATAILNTLLATIGFVRNRVTRPEEQPLAASLLFDLAGIVAVVALVLR